jgi:hypothetical protein
MTSKSMKIVAGLAAGGALAYAAVQMGGGDTGLAWGRHLGEVLYSKLPAVLKMPAAGDGYPAYRYTLLKYIVSLSLLVQLSKVMAIMSARHLKMDFRQKISLMAVRASALFTFPDLHVFAKAAMQPNLLAALRSGIDPFSTVAAGSEIGKQLGLKENLNLIGFSNPFKKDFHERAYLKNHALSALAQNQNNATRNAGILAMRIACEKYKTDLPTLMVVADAIVQSKEQGEKEMDKIVDNILSNPQFYTFWSATALELAPLLSKDIKAAQVDFSQVKDKELVGYIKLAEIVGKKVEEAQQKHPHWFALKNKFKMMVNGCYQKNFLFKESF